MAERSYYNGEERRENIQSYIDKLEGSRQFQQRFVTIVGVSIISLAAWLVYSVISVQKDLELLRFQMNLKFEQVKDKIDNLPK